MVLGCEQRGTENTTDHGCFIDGINVLREVSRVQKHIVISAGPDSQKRVKGIFHGRCLQLPLESLNRARC